MNGVNLQAIRDQIETIPAPQQALVLSVVNELQNLREKMALICAETTDHFARVPYIHNLAQVALGRNDFMPYYGNEHPLDSSASTDISDCFCH